MRTRSVAATTFLALLLPGLARAQPPAPSPSPSPLGRPCEAEPLNRALDFWVGDWDVRPAGAPPSRPPSRSHIERVEDGCVIAEYYTTPQGYSGRSINAYDAAHKRWQQVWMDNQGGVHNYFGEARDGNVYYQADQVYVPGQPKLVKAKMTFFNLGRDQVRQLGEQSTDEGKTWTTAYDLIYTRRVTQRTD
jgi:hypothetical protein